MIQITPHMRILVAVEPADFRKGIDGLAQLCREALETDPLSGTVFVFRNRRATAVKLLVYDGQGFCIWATHYPSKRPPTALLPVASPARVGPVRRILTTPCPRRHRVLQASP